MRKRYAFDAAILVAYLLAANPAVTGVPVHEWLGLGVVLALAVHLALGLDKLAAFGRSLDGGYGAMRALRVGLALALLLALAVCVVSGVMVSGHVLAALGLYAPGYFLWDPLHAASAKVLLALLLVHLALTAGQVVRGVRAKKPANSDDDIPPETDERIL